MGQRTPKRKNLLRRRLQNGGAPAGGKRSGAAALGRSMREAVLERSLLKAEQQLRVLRSLAYLDDLCEVYNRRAFNDEMRRVTGRAQRHGGEAAVAIFDVDHLKTINDTHGHEVGDVALVAIAQTIKSSIRSSDFLARIGGDEFALILYEIDESATRAKVEDICRRVAETDVETSTGRLELSISAGHAMISFEATGEALRHADHAMYRSKLSARTIYQHR